MGAGPLFPSQANKGHAACLLRAIRPRCTTPRRGRAASEIRCQRKLDVLLAYLGSRGTSGRVHDPVLASGKATIVVHPHTGCLRSRLGAVRAQGQNFKSR